MTIAVVQSSAIRRNARAVTVGAESLEIGLARDEAGSIGNILLHILRGGEDEVVIARGVNISNTNPIKSWSRFGITVFAIGSRVASRTKRSRRRTSALRTGTSRVADRSICFVETTNVSLQSPLMITRIVTNLKYESFVFATAELRSTAIGSVLDGGETWITGGTSVQDAVGKHELRRRLPGASVRGINNIQASDTNSNV